MQLSDFKFDLPAALIAQYPAVTRAASRLLLLNSHTATWRDAFFPDLLAELHPGDLLVCNDTKVIPARLFGQKESGGKVEVFIERILDSQRALAQIRASKAPRPGTQIKFAETCTAHVDGREGEFYLLRFESGTDILHALETYGRIPLPPYIRRVDEPLDKERYQTVYARSHGAVAAPTAGLHFDENMLRAIHDKGINTAYVTLHVGAGTFQPVRIIDIQQHQMHKEWMTLSAEVVNRIEQTRRDGHRVIAVGTTTVRCLETAALTGQLRPYQGDTDIFITPGFQFNVVDALLTNFHLPESTLLMLVCAFGGYDFMLSAYRHAVASQYRFFSYGDAMFIQKGVSATSECKDQSHAI